MTETVKPVHLVSEHRADRQNSEQTDRTQCLLIWTQGILRSPCWRPNAFILFYYTILWSFAAFIKIDFQRGKANVHQHVCSLGIKPVRVVSSFLHELSSTWSFKQVAWKMRMLFLLSHLHAPFCPPDPLLRSPLLCPSLPVEWLGLGVPGHPNCPGLMTIASSEHANANHDGNNAVEKGHSLPDSGTWGNCNTHIPALCTHSKRWALPQKHLLNNVFFSERRDCYSSCDFISVLVILIQSHNKNEPRPCLNSM